MAVNTKDEYIRAWNKTMAEIWQDKLRQLDVYDTGALFASVKTGFVSDQRGTVQIVHKFLEYGLYVDAGTGNGFKRGNGGDLGFNPTREPKPWFNKKYFASLKERYLNNRIEHNHQD